MGYSTPVEKVLRAPRRPGGVLRTRDTCRYCYGATSSLNAVLLVLYQVAVVACDAIVPGSCMYDTVDNFRTQSALR
jgi:hypothetical protein